MADAFCPLLVVVKGETKESGFLPDGNYVEINDKKCPIGHCFTLEMPMGSCQLAVHTPPPNAKHRASTVVGGRTLYRLTLTVDAARNIVDASFEQDNDTESPMGSFIFDNECKHAVEHREKIAQWRTKQAPATASTQTHSSAPTQTYAPTNTSTYTQSSTTSVRSGGKLFGWGLALMVIFCIGIANCFLGELEFSSLTVYIPGAVIGLVMFIKGWRQKRANNKSYKYN